MAGIKYDARTDSFIGDGTEMNQLKSALAKGDLNVKIDGLTDYEDKDSMHFAVDIKNIRDAAILALAILKSDAVDGMEIIVFNANPKMFDDTLVMPIDYTLDESAAKLMKLSDPGTESKFVKEYKHLLYTNRASGINVSGEIFGSEKYTLTFGYMKDADATMAQITVSGNPKADKVEDLLDEIFEEMDMLKGFLKESK